MYLKKYLICSVISCYTCFAENTTKNLESFIVGGALVDIKKVSYAVSLTISCSGIWGCGASILNQKVLLTAAHCFENCGRKAENIVVSIGHENKVKGDYRITKRFKMHEKYNEDTVENDIALVFTKHNIRFNDKVGRVAIMRNPPYHELAIIAGWGAIDEKRHISSNYLKGLRLEVMSRNKCGKYMFHLPHGTFCAGPIQSQHYVSHGDSGSALVVRRYIQIGILSYKNPSTSPSLAVYSDVAYHINWIKYNARRGFCG